MECLCDPAVRGGREQDQVPAAVPGQLPHQFVTQVAVSSPARSGAVGFVHDDELWCMQQEDMLVSGILHEVDADHLHRVVLIDRAIWWCAAVELPNSGRTDYYCIEVKFFDKFLLPLVAEVRWAENCQPSHFTTFPQLADNEPRLDGLAYSDVVGYEQTDGIKPQGHHKRDQLVGPRTHRDTA